MRDEQDGYLTIGDDLERCIIALEGTVLDEFGGGIPSIGIIPIPPATILAAIIDDGVPG